jgi:hypothetical protein
MLTIHTELAHRKRAMHSPALCSPRAHRPTQTYLHNGEYDDAAHCVEPAPRMCDFVFYTVEQLVWVPLLKQACDARRSELRVSGFQPMHHMLAHAWSRSSLQGCFQHHSCLLCAFTDTCRRAAVGA